MSEEEHKVICKYDEEKAPELIDARRIVEFINRHHASPEQVRLVVHCHGGVSRSAAVAKWLGEFCAVLLPQLGDGIHDLDGANPRVLRLLMKATVRGLQAQEFACSKHQVPDVARLEDEPWLRAYRSCEQPRASQAGQP